MRMALVVSRYHAFVTDRLEAGARATLREDGLADENIETFSVPGAYEIAQAATRIAQSGNWSAVICLGCLIRGETSHFDYIAHATSAGIMRAAQTTGVPMAFGVLTTNTAEESWREPETTTGTRGGKRRWPVPRWRGCERVPGPRS
jgi:6,7-dimethyl-8-ribityllumazine synthase